MNFFHPRWFWMHNQIIFNNLLNFKGNLNQCQRFYSWTRQKTLPENHQLIIELWILSQLDVLEGTWTLDRRIPSKPTKGNDVPQVAAADSPSSFDGDLILISKHRRAKQNSPNTKWGVYPSGWAVLLACLTSVQTDSSFVPSLENNLSVGHINLFTHTFDTV